RSLTNINVPINPNIQGHNNKTESNKFWVEYPIQKLCALILEFTTIDITGKIVQPTKQIHNMFEPFNFLNSARINLPNGMPSCYPYKVFF
ncbi:hypothetical protein Q604_UNBC15719G0002, partial [human gut metagenome]